MRFGLVVITAFCMPICVLAADEAVPAKLLPADPAVYPEYAGSASCAECHKEAYDKWRGSHHANAQRPISGELDKQAFEPKRTIKHGAQTSVAEIKDGKYVLTTMGPDGKPQEFVPDNALGVDPLWQYLMPFGDGRWQLTELAFDPAKKEWFNVYNDEDRQHYEWGHWSQRGMNWNSMCATCHTTAFKKNYDEEADVYRSTFLELGVGCEQCHGPMKKHVEFQNSHPEGAYFTDPTIKKLDPDQMLAVCGSCHSRRGDLTNDFMPGEQFLDHFEPVLPDLTDTFYPDGQIRDEDFEYNVFMLSYMHAADIRCMNCHTPHTAKRQIAGNDLCLQCHKLPMRNRIAIDPAGHGHHPMDKPGSECTDCHMPQTVYMARHWRHDHGQTIPDPLLTRVFGIPNACDRCHKDEGIDWQIKYVDEWYGPRMDRPTRQRARLLARLKRGDTDCVAEVIELLRGEENPTWRAVIAKFLNQAVLETRDEELRLKLQSELVRLLDDTSPLARAAATDALEPLATMLVEPLEKGLNDSYRLGRLKAAWALRTLTPPDSPVGKELLSWLRNAVDQPTGAMRWATYLADTQRIETALKWFKKATEWDRAAAPFRHAYAVALSRVGRLDEALTQLVKASDIDANESVYPYSMGLLYAEIGRLPEARDAIKAAIARAPNQGRYWFNLAMAEHRLAQPEAALDALARAEELEPTIAEYPYAAATIYLDLNRPDQAKSALRRALRIQPDHQGALALLKDL